MIRKKIKLQLFILASALVLLSCSSNDNLSPTPEPSEQRTLFVYMPLCGLYSNFLVNLQDLEKAMVKTGLANQRVLVFLASNQDRTTQMVNAELFEMKVTQDRSSKTNVVTRETLKSYTYEISKYTTVSGLTSLISDIKTLAPGDIYSMIIGCHGRGWIPVTRNAEPQTRWFGGTTSASQTDISTLREALDATGTHLEYILFDDCYMSNVEVAYELKDRVDYVIGSTCEIMSYGMPYEDMGSYLLGIPNYQKAVESFYTFYSNYYYPYGALGVVETKQLDALAAEMRNLNNTYVFDESLYLDVQRMDGFSIPIFYDFKDYLDKLTQSTTAQVAHYRLELAVPYKAHTGKFYCESARKLFDINIFAGMTISDASKNEETEKKVETSWWKATH